MSNIIQVNYDAYFTPWTINERLKYLTDIPLMSFDIETKGLYQKEERKKAIKLLEKEDDLPLDVHKLTSIVANNSGLSFPAITETTHFIFGLSKDYSVVFVTPTQYFELVMWNWVRNYRGKLLIHNTGFDLKVMYHRIGCFPHDYEDTALMLKTLINNSDSWRAKIGLKENMGSYYPPAWSMYEEYEPEDPKDEKFLQYAATDGAATYYLYELIQEHA